MPTFRGTLKSATDLFSLGQESSALNMLWASMVLKKSIGHDVYGQFKQILFCVVICRSFEPRPATLAHIPNNTSWQFHCSGSAGKDLNKMPWRHHRLQAFRAFVLVSGCAYPMMKSSSSFLGFEALTGSFSTGFFFFFAYFVGVFFTSSSTSDSV